MRLYTVKYDGKHIIAVENDGLLFSVMQMGFDFKDMNDLICRVTGADMVLITNKCQDGTCMPLDADKISMCAPIMYPMQDVICLGINYDEHAVEADRFSSKDFGGERPYTIYFSKRVNCAVADGEMIPSYKNLVDSLDYEVELGVIIGKDAKNVSVRDALDYVFGYTIINDISARNLQTRHKQWYLGKSLDGFTPMGPCIVTADEIENVQNLEIRSYVNDALRQHSNTSYMIQTVAGAISELSYGMTLKAGTVIATGTPAGVGLGMIPPTFLKTGDVITCEIEKIGKITNVIGD